MVREPSERGIMMPTGPRVNRRNLLVRAGAAFVAMVIGAPASAGPARRRVTVSGQFGTVFPPLELAVRLNKSSRRYEIISDDDHGAIDVAIFPAGARDSERGLMTDEDIARAHETVAAILADEFGYRASLIEADPGPAFWYPFAGRRAVCCRLTVTPA